MYALSEEQVTAFTMRVTPQRVKQTLGPTFSLLLSLLTVCIAGGLFALFFILFAECQDSKALTTTNEPDQNCERVLLRQDGVFAIDVNNQWSSQSGFAGRSAVFRVSFAGYENTEGEYRKDLRLLLQKGRSLLQNLNGMDHVSVFQELVATPVSLSLPSSLRIYSCAVAHIILCYTTPVSRSGWLEDAAVCSSR